MQDQEEAGSSMGEDWGRAGTYTWHPWHQQHHHADTSTDRSDDWVDIESGESQLTLDTLDTAKKSYHSSSVGQYSCVWTDRWVGGWTVDTLDTELGHPMAAWHGADTRYTPRH